MSAIPRNRSLFAEPGQVHVSTAKGHFSGFGASPGAHAHTGVQRDAAKSPDALAHPVSVTLFGRS